MRRREIAFVSRLHFPVTSLGPGNRLGIWFQGCSIKCSGCISADTWAHGKRGVDIESLFGTIHPWLNIADGVTISGGEPLQQPEALLALLRHLHERRGGEVDVLLYTGFTLEIAQPFLDRAVGLVDAVISDPYEAKAPATLALRGSDNQRLTFLTDLGRTRLGPYERRRIAQDDSFDVMFAADGEVWLAGIPRKEDLRRLTSILAGLGTKIDTTQVADALLPKDHDE